MKYRPDLGELQDNEPEEADCQQLLLEACEALLPWVAKANADKAFVDCAVPNGASHAMRLAWDAIAKSKPPKFTGKSAWHLVALKAGLYRADTDVSTPDKWLTAQLNAYERLKVPPFDKNI